MEAQHPPQVSLSACVAYGPDGRGRAIDASEVPALLTDDVGGFVWLGLYEPDHATLDWLRELLDLHPLAVEDAHKAHQRPKLEAYGQCLFIATHTAQATGHRTAFGETHVFLGQRYLVTVRHDKSQSYAGVREHCEQHPELLSLGPSYGLYAVLDHVVDNLLPILDRLQDDLNAAERAVFTDRFHRETIERLYRLRQELTRLRLAVSPLQDILGQLVHLHPDLIRREMRLHFRDVLDHAVRLNEGIDALRDMVGAAMTVNLALVNVRQGEIVKRLAGWAALAAVPTLVASWYGMNFEHMPELAGSASYLVTAAVTGAVVIGLYALLRRAGWL